MKYFKNFVTDPVPITEALHRVMRALENDPKAGDVQFPEIRTNLTRPRGLSDQLIFAGHGHIRFPDIQMARNSCSTDPVKVHFNKHNLMATIWFDFCGHFTNMICVFTSVCTVAEDVEPKQDEYLDSTQSTVCEDSEEGVSVRTLLRHLQRLKAVGRRDAEKKGLRMTMRRMNDMGYRA